MKINKAIITAAGFGSRFLPITKTIPKEMLPIINKPIIHWIVEECLEAQIEEVIIVAAPDEVKIFEDYFYGHAENIRMLMQLQNKMDRWEKVKAIFSLPKVTVIPEDRTIPYGNGRPILSAKRYVENEEGFIVCWGDDLVLSNVSCIKQIKDAFEKNECDGVLAIQYVEGEEISKYGSVDFNEVNMKVSCIIEKPLASEAPSQFASFGRYVLTPEIYKYLLVDSTGKDGEVWLADAIDKVVQNGNITACKIEGKWYTTGDPINYFKAQEAYYKKYL